MDSEYKVLNSGLQKMIYMSKGNERNECNIVAILADTRRYSEISGISEPFQTAPVLTDP